jgi:hypothetical protein
MIATTVAVCVLLVGAITARANPHDGTAMQKSADASDANAQQPVKKDEKVDRLGPGISPPRPMHISATPVVTDDELRKANFAGVTVVELEVNTQGVPEHPHVVRSAAKDAKKADKRKG